MPVGTTPGIHQATLQELRAVRPPVRGLGYGLATRWDREIAAQNPAEYRLAARMMPNRRADFLAGRCALRRALADAGLPELSLPPIPIGNRNQPQLRPGITASVSHSGGIAVAIAAKAARFSSVGIDLELSGLPVRAAHLVLTEPELAWMARASSPAGREHRLVTAFSAKEAVYKALDPIIAAGTLRRIHLVPAAPGFVAWPADRRDVRLPVWVHPVGTGVLAWTTLHARSPRPG